MNLTDVVKRLSYLGSHRIASQETNEVSNVLNLFFVFSPFDFLSLSLSLSLSYKDKRIF